MARVLIYTAPGPGHAYPPVATAIALRDRGHEVRGATFHTGRIHARRDAPAVLDLLARGTLDVEAVAFEDAADALLERFIKLVFFR